MASRPAPPRLDQTDVEILRHLTDDARQSLRAIARDVGMSAPAVADRIARLEAAGVIEGYRAQLNFALLGHSLTVVVDVSSERSDNQRELAELMLRIPEVERVDLLTGKSDLQVRLKVRDQDHLNEVYFDRLLTLPGIRHTESSLVLCAFTPDNFAERVLARLAVTEETRP